ncbi:hypothetical protein K254310026_23060 [Clostridium tetani]|nr:hypothetical protein K254310026_23060 [Clostridium tetani]
MRDMYLHKDEKEYLFSNYKIGERYKVIKLENPSDCDYLKVGLTGILININDEGFFIFEWDGNFNTHREFPNWLLQDKVQAIRKEDAEIIER